MPSISRSYLLSTTVLALLLPIQSEGTEIGVLRESRYVIEGRDRLDGDDIYSLHGGYRYGNTGIGGQVVTGINTDYDEGRFWLNYELSIDNFEIVPAATYVTYSDNTPVDHEYSLTLIANSDEDSAATLHYVYSKQAAGGFWELNLTQHYSYYQLFTLSPFFTLAVNKGYVPDEHTGLNNAIVGLNLEYPLGRSFKLTGYAAYTRALNKKRGETLDNFGWAGIGIFYVQ